MTELSARDSNLKHAVKTETRRIPRKKRRQPRQRSRGSVILVRLASTAVLLVVWEIYGRQVNPLQFSAPSAIAVELWNMTSSGELLDALSESVVPFSIGLALSICVGLPLGALLGRSRLANLLFLHLLNSLYVIPTVALVPLIILWFGLGVSAKAAIVFLIAVFPLLFNTMDGIRATSKAYVEVASAYGANEWDITRTVTLPAAIPFILSGFRQSAGRALIGLVIAELFTGIAGLGALLVVYANRLQTAKVLVVVVVLGLLGLLLMSFGDWLERRVAPWTRTEHSW